jgi:hypothetical protein
MNTTRTCLGFTETLLASAVFCLFTPDHASVWADDWYAQGDFAPRTRMELVLVNDLDIDRANCPIVVRRDQVPTTDLHELEVTVVDPSLPPSPEPSAERLKVAGGHELRQEKNGHAVFHQMDDIDKDGVWDEIFFMTDIKARQAKKIFIYLGFNGRGWNPHETHAGIGSYCRHLVPFWESKNVGWKLWFATSADVYGKRKPMLMSNRLYMENLDGYGVTLIDSNMGSDIMSVDFSFGGGAMCLFEDPDSPDIASMARDTPARAAAKVTEKFNTGQIGDTRYAFDVVVNGPMRSMIRVKTMNWNSGRGSYEVEQLYTAYAHQSYSTCRARMTRFMPKNSGALFGCGIRKKPNENKFHQKGGVVISSGPEAVMDPDSGTITSNIAFIANALVVKSLYSPSYQFVPARLGNHALKLPYREDGAYEYLIAAAWSEGSVLNTYEDFEAYVLKTALEYNNPVRTLRVKAENRPER